MSLDTVDANVLRKWGSAWLDLTYADLGLDARRNTPHTGANHVVRRALWESAVVSYGRVGQGDKKRKIDLTALFEASGDPEASDFHNTIMKWRHGHVAHRADAAFETVDVLLDVDATLTPNAVQVVIQSAVGPQDHEELAEKFRAHVKLLRDTLWHSFMEPLATNVAKRAQRQPSKLGKVMPFPVMPPEELIATLTLWARPELPNTT